VLSLQVPCQLLLHRNKYLNKNNSTTDKHRMWIHSCPGNRCHSHSHARPLETIAASPSSWPLILFGGVLIGSNKTSPSNSASSPSSQNRWEEPDRSRPSFFVSYADSQPITKAVWTHDFRKIFIRPIENENICDIIRKKFSLLVSRKFAEFGWSLIDSLIDSFIHRASRSYPNSTITNNS
jgi:hypothetical protein